MQEDNNFNVNNDNNDNNEENKNSNNSYDFNNQYSSYSSSNYSQNYSNYGDSNNFDYNNYNNSNNTRGNSKRHSGVIVTLAVAVVVFIIFTVLLVCMLANLNDSISNRINMSDESLTIVKNSPKITLTENTDVNFEPKSISEVVQKIGNSVVEISTASVVTDGFFNQYVTSGAGSGVIITQSEEAGYLLTNYHVIDGAKEILVRLTNGDEYAAQTLGSDESKDLAVLRIEKKSNESFTVAPLGDSDKLLVGQQVIAIGNPLGSLGGTVTDGIISALDRTVEIDKIPMVLLQHNAAINPGNSGGGLFDSMGNLIGIVNAKTSKTGIEGLGFAIPINIAEDFFNRVMITEPAIGIRVKYGSLNRVVGMYVVDVLNSSEFEMYDRIVSINDKAISNEEDYYEAIGNVKTNKTVNIVVERNRKYIEINIILK